MPRVVKEPESLQPQQTEAISKLLEQVLTSDGTTIHDTVLMRALSADAPSIRATGLKAGVLMVRGPGSSKAVELMAVFDDLLDKESGPAHFTYGILSLYGELGRNLGSAPLEKLLARLDGQLSSESESVGKGAARGLAAALDGALDSGMVELEDVQQRAQAGLEAAAAANTASESRAAAFRVGAACAAAGAELLQAWGVVTRLFELVASGGGPEHCREAALLAIDQLCLRLRSRFEPYLLPQLEAKVIAMYADKDRKVVDAAAKVVRTLVTGLNPLAVKLVLPALYRGMEVTCAWRTKEACIQALGLLAQHAPSSTGPCLQEAMPKLVECLNDSNAKVQAAAAAVIPVIITCVDNPETQTLKKDLAGAIIDPKTTGFCLEQILTTTFVNSMDGTSLAFIMPVIIRGLRDPTYDLVKKAVTCAGNMCALIKSPSDIAPFLPAIMTEIAKCLEHSSPDVREGAADAKARLEAGAGGRVDPSARPTAVAARIAAGLGGGAAPAELRTHAGDLGAAWMEIELGGAVNSTLFDSAPAKLAALLADELQGYEVPAAALAAAAAAAVGDFRQRLSESARSILADDVERGIKDSYALDVQNCILAFAGRVLLKGCDLRFERGHRYGIVGQNGTGKTTLLNRMAAKDINSFDMGLKVHYIRHEVSDAGELDVHQYMQREGPAGCTPSDIEATLNDVGFPESLQAAAVSTLSGGWKMKLSIALSILHKPELLLLDEPTNHLDRNAIDWLTKHLVGLEGVTILLVSHDYDFLDEVATDIAHYDNGGKAGNPCRLVYYRTGFKGFQKLKPEIVAGLPTAAKTMGAVGGGASESESESESDGSLVDGVDGMSMGATIDHVDALIASGQVLPIRFPDPGKPEGIRTFRKPVMTLKDVSFKYDDTDKLILSKASATVTLGSRAVLVGANGAGKSTFLKLMVGDLEPNEGAGELWKHHALRLSYIAQHSLYHLEDHLNGTPQSYIQERFRQGQDRELSLMKTLQLTDDEKEEMKETTKVCEVIGRQQQGLHVESARHTPHTRTPAHPRPPRTRTPAHPCTRAPAHRSAPRRTPAFALSAASALPAALLS